MMRGRFCDLCVRRLPQMKDVTSKRLYSISGLTNREVKQRRNELFENEKRRQKSFIKRIEKIAVEYKGVPENASLMMNKDLSTPYNCALHIGDIFARRSVVARVNGKLWDMHTPLTEDCELELLHMLDEDPIEQNTVFWRACSFVLGYVLENSFKDSVKLNLCAFPAPNVESGSFVYDVDLNLPDWKPSYMELTSLGLEATALLGKNLEFERLEVDEEIALKMFEDNPYKLDQIPAIAAKNSQGRVAVYRVGDHVDVTKGPLIGNTNQIGRFSFTSIYDIDTEKYGPLKRVQGLALPSDVHVHSYVFDFLCKKAKRKNTDGLHLYRNRVERSNEAQLEQNA